MKVLRHLKQTAKAGFTLIELLVVITIIGILIGLASFMLPDAMKAAKETETKGIITAIKVGLTEYKTTYYRFPQFVMDSATDDYGWADASTDVIDASLDPADAKWTELYRTLANRPAGEDADADNAFFDANNPKRREFFVPEDQYLNDPSDPIASVTFTDAFGREMNIKLDSNLDNKLTDLPNVETGATNGFDRYGDIAIWSYGNDPEIPEDYVTSWR